MRVIIREAAYDDLDRIYAWIAKDRPRSADAVIDRILESAERLGRLLRRLEAQIAQSFDSSRREKIHGINRSRREAFRRPEIGEKYFRPLAGFVEVFVRRRAQDLVRLRVAPRGQGRAGSHGSLIGPGGSWFEHVDRRFGKQRKGARPGDRERALRDGFASRRRRRRDLPLRRARSKRSDHAALRLEILE